jgi:hypothetical protein
MINNNNPVGFLLTLLSNLRLKWEYLSPLSDNSVAFLIKWFDDFILLNGTTNLIILFLIDFDSYFN